jgi:2',3'-cyclic-nucleotide 2'-phosphodiesterase (5'-nucleotidase family)
VKLESKLAKAKAKGKAVGVFKIDLDKMRNEINLLEEKLDKEKTKAKHLGEKNELLKHYNQMIDTNNNQLNRNNIFFLEKMSRLTNNNPPQCSTS